MVGLEGMRADGEAPSRAETTLVSRITLTRAAAPT